VKQMAKMTKMNDPIQRLLTAYPDYKEILDDIAQLRQTTRQLPFPQFFEPFAAVELVKEKKETKAALAMLSPELLAMWITHMSHGARVRMETLEDSILDGLANGTLFIPAILTRCHLEVAGFAAYANKLLRRFSDTRDYAQLKKDILQTAYSSAMAKNDPSIIDRMSIPGVFDVPRSAMNGIDALQEFFDIAAAKGHLNIHALYSMLCDFGHPSIVGLRSFVQILDDTDKGRVQQYARKEQLQRADVLNLLTALIWSMRGGYTSAALMYSGEVVEQEDGFRYQKPDLESGKAIREMLLQHPRP
jgi:hypothetical protein